MQNSALYKGTVHTKGTAEEKLQQVATEKENLLENKVHFSVTDLQNGTNPDSSTQAFQSKDDLLIDLTTRTTEGRYQQDPEVHYGLNIQQTNESDSKPENNVPTFFFS